MTKKDRKKIEEALPLIRQALMKGFIQEHHSDWEGDHFADTHSISAHRNWTYRVKPEPVEGWVCGGIFFTEKRDAMIYSKTFGNIIVHVREVVK